MRLLDLFYGRGGWGRAFAARGWEVIGIDLTLPAPEFIPEGVTVIERDVLSIDADWVRRNEFDFICASSPCEQFSVHGMKHFHPNPPWPEMGIKLFEHTRMLCEAAGIPYCLENVKAAQQFVGAASVHAGSFHLWWNLFPRFGLRMPEPCKSKWFSRPGHPGNTCEESLKGKRERKAKLATIPPVLADTIADYAEQVVVRETA